jgi:hypothetical protein
MVPHIDSPSRDGALLALFGLRANGATKALPAPAPPYRIVPSGRLVTEQELIDRLASMPKPLYCSAQMVDGVLEIMYAPLSDFPHELDFHRKCLEDERVRGGFMGFLKEHYRGTSETLQVLATDRSEVMLLPLNVVEQWHADYHGFSFSGDHVNNPHAVQDPLYIKARTLGAVGVLRFTPPNTGNVSIKITIDITPPREGDDLEEAARRCIQDAIEFRGFLPMFLKSAELRALFDDYAEESRRFFGTRLPSELAGLFSEWEGMKRGPAA